VYVDLRAIVVECKVPELPSRVEEVASMARNIGYDVLEVIVQKRKSVHHSTCLGPGKLVEIRKLVEEKDIEYVIFANTLPSSQVFKVQRQLGGDVKVIDRNLLILEVFDKRAMTKEAKLQIRLARLRYTFSWGREFLRLEGILGEQVGWSGPGDYPYSEYEREARKRISRLEAELRDLYRKKDLIRERRHELGFPIVALAGYTQSGKTTFFNRLASEEKSVGLGPFTTLSTVARRVTVPSNDGNTQFMLVDSIGLIEDMHPIILKAFNTTLGEITQADLILLFVDVGEDLSDLTRKLASTDKTLRQTGVTSRIIVCANKIDRASQDHLEMALKEIGRYFPGAPVLQISALTGKGVNNLLSKIVSELKETAVKTSA
jgi:GTP-binding protein HflX